MEISSYAAEDVVQSQRVFGLRLLSAGVGAYSDHHEFQAFDQAFSPAHQLAPP